MNKHRLNVAHSKAIHTERGAARTRAEHARASVVMELIESNHDVDTSLCAVPQHSASTDRPRVCRACAEFFAQHSATLRNTRQQQRARPRRLRVLLRNVSESCGVLRISQRTGACRLEYPHHSTATGCEQAIIGRIAARGLARPSIGLLTYTYI